MSDATPVPGVDDEPKGLRARYRAIRNNADVQEVAGNAKPFLAGAAFVGGMAVDAPTTLALTTLRVGRAIQARRAHDEKIEKV